MNILLAVFTVPAFVAIASFLVIDYRACDHRRKAIEIVKAFKLAERAVRKDRFRFRFLRAGNGYVVIKETDQKDGL